MCNIFYVLCLTRALLTISLSARGVHISRHFLLSGSAYLTHSELQCQIYEQRAEIGPRWSTREYPLLGLSPQTSTKSASGSTPSSYISYGLLVPESDPDVYDMLAPRSRAHAVYWTHNGPGSLAKVTSTQEPKSGSGSDGIIQARHSPPRLRAYELNHTTN